MSALLKREADDFTTVLTGVFTTVFFFFLYIYSERALQRGGGAAEAGSGRQSERVAAGDRHAA